MFCDGFKSSDVFKYLIKLFFILAKQKIESNLDANGTCSYLGNSDANFQTAKHGMMGYLFPIMADLVVG